MTLAAKKESRICFDSSIQDRKGQGNWGSLMERAGVELKGLNS